MTILETWTALRAPFDPLRYVDLVPRPGGDPVATVPEEAVQDRLDQVLGPEGWWTDGLEWRGVWKVILTLLIPGDPIPLVKTGPDFLGAAERFGIGRPDPSPIPDRHYSLSSVPSGAAQPSSGPALYFWLMNSSTRFGLDLLGWINRWGRDRKLRDPMISWDVETVSDAYGDLAAWLAAEGKIEAPPQPKFAADPVERKGPIDISGLDDLLELKLRISVLGREVAERWAGVWDQPQSAIGDTEVMRAIDGVTQERRGTMVRHLRDCADRHRLLKAESALREEIGQLRQIQDVESFDV